MTAFDPADREMTRDRGQVLYRYRPMQTFDHGGGYTAQVRSYGHDAAFSGADVDPAYLIAEAMRLVRRWRQQGNGANGTSPNSDRAPEFPDDQQALAAQQYEVVIPGRVLCRVWPRVVRCSTPRCGRVWEAGDWVPGGGWPGTCPSCHSAGRHRQLQYVFAHHCGEVKPFTPPEHLRSRHCTHNAGYRLNDRASRFLDFRWECLRCGTAETIQDYCNNPGCTWTEKRMSPLVHTASTAYSGKGLTLVNVPTRETAARMARDAFTVATLARWLGICDWEEARRLIDGGERQVEIPQVVMESIQTMRAAGLTDQADKLMAGFGPGDLGALTDRVTDLLGFDPLDEQNPGRELASNLAAYERVRDELPKITLADLKAKPASTGRAALYAATYDGALRRAGLDPNALALVTEFPATYLAVGYSRGGFSPQEADLVAYRGRSRRGQAVQTLVYAHPTMTEALVFSLDEDRVARWLVANGAVSVDDLRNAGGPKRWFAAHLQGVEGQLPPPWDPDHEPERGGPEYGARLLYGLIHTMAHQLLRSLAVDSGYAETALSEYLFPYDLAFAIHPNGGSEFILGGLRTVMEQNLDEVLERAVDNYACIYDPNCNEANQGADHGCLFLPETACQAWNWFLSRWYLFGSPRGELVGYWSPQVSVP